MVGEMCRWISWWWWSTPHTLLPLIARGWTLKSTCFLLYSFQPTLMHVPHICVTRPQVLFYTLLGARVEPWALIFILIPDKNLFALSTSRRGGGQRFRYGNVSDQSQSTDSSWFGRALTWWWWWRPTPRIAMSVGRPPSLVLAPSDAHPIYVWAC